MPLAGLTHKHACTHLRTSKDSRNDMLLMFLGNRDKLLLLIFRCRSDCSMDSSIGNRANKLLDRSRNCSRDRAAHQAIVEQS